MRYGPGYGAWIVLAGQANSPEPMPTAMIKISSGAGMELWQTGWADGEAHDA
jgi:hypothetical protein